MINQPNKSLSHAVYMLRLHIVFVTKYRRKVMSGEMLDYLKTAFTEILSGWRCSLIEFGGEEDHVHLLV
ncbi:MAG TPA: IS200/IS605 family transposase, partial [Nitrospirota bacterium]|nr:IS200/IS605 family transposase [Nitrospirota bacterium]